MHALKLRRVGTSTGIVLPKELLARLNVETGDVLYATVTPTGILLTPRDETFAQQMTAARSIMRRRRQALRELAK